MKRVLIGTNNLQHTANIIMPVGCLGNTSSSDQKDLKNQSSVGLHLDEGGGNGHKQQVKKEIPA